MQQRKNKRMPCGRSTAAVS